MIQRSPANRLALLIVGLSILLSACEPDSPPPIKWREKSALLNSNSATSSCTEPTKGERELLELAVRAVELSESNGPFDWLEVGARKDLSKSGLVRYSDGQFVSLCFGQAHLERVGNALARRGGLGQHRVVEYELDLVAKLPNPSADIVKDVAKVAFSESPAQSEIFVDEDIRPYARAVLATFGQKASQYGEAAFLQIGSTTAMGTGAAQIATAVGYPGALERAAELFEATLESVPYSKPIPWHTRNRLYELAWAVSYGGEAAHKYTPLIRKLMDRQVEALTPPFGATEHTPKRMCLVLERLAGAEALRSYKYCSDNSTLEN